MGLSQFKSLEFIVPSKVHIFWEGHKYFEIFTLLLSYVVPAKSKVEISQNFVAFSEYMNFTWDYELKFLNCESPMQLKIVSTSG